MPFHFGHKLQLRKHRKNYHYEHHNLRGGETIAIITTDTMIWRCDNDLFRCRCISTAYILVYPFKSPPPSLWGSYIHFMLNEIYPKPLENLITVGSTVASVQNLFIFCFQIPCCLSVRPDASASAFVRLKLTVYVLASL